MAASQIFKMAASQIFKMAASQYIFVVAMFYIYFLSSTNAKLHFMKQHQCDRCAKAVYKSIFGEEEGLETFSGLFHLYSLLSPTMTLHNRNVRRSKSVSRRPSSSKHHLKNMLYFLLLMLLLSGDVQPNPGPATRGGRTPKYPCTVCGRGVRSNSKAISCDVCEGWTHINCCDVSLVVYNDSVKHGTPLSHICDTCLIGELPSFHNLTVQNDSQTNAELNHPDPVATTDVPDQYELFKKKGLHFLHINARSLLPKLTDARLLVQRTNAAVLAVTETWLDESVTIRIMLR